MTAKVCCHPQTPISLGQVAESYWLNYIPGWSQIALKALAQTQRPIYYSPLFLNFGPPYQLARQVGSISVWDPLLKDQKSKTEKGLM